MPVGHVRQAGEDIFQVGVGIEVTTATAFKDGIDNGPPFTGFSFSGEQPVFLVMPSSAKKFMRSCQLCGGVPKEFDFLVFLS